MSLKDKLTKSSIKTNKEAKAIQKATEVFKEGIKKPLVPADNRNPTPYTDAWRASLIRRQEYLLDQIRDAQVNLSYVETALKDIK